MRHLAASVLELLGRVAPQPRTELADEAVRRIAFDLACEGVPPSTAMDAANALAQFLARNDLEPSKMLEGELTRVHPRLTVKSLDFLRRYAADAKVMAGAHAEKSATMARVRRLAGAFAQSAAAATPLLALIVTSALLGCGLKTRPVSDVVEPRPDIPFHASSAAPAPDAPTPASAPAEAPKAVDAPGPQGETSSVAPSPAPIAQPAAPKEGQPDGKSGAP
jgi:hypothetical protein